MRSVCVLNGGGVEPSEDDEIDGDEGGLSGCVVIGSCGMVGLVGCSGKGGCPCMVVIRSSGVGTGRVPVRAAAKGGVDGTLGGGSLAVARGDDGEGAPDGRRSSIA